MLLVHASIHEPREDVNGMFVCTSMEGRGKVGKGQCICSPDSVVSVDVHTFVLLIK